MVLSRHTTFVVVVVCVLSKTLVLLSLSSFSLLFLSSIIAVAVVISAILAGSSAGNTVGDNATQSTENSNVYRNIKNRHNAL